MRVWYQRALVGALGGCLATLPMTLFMEAAHPFLPPDQQYPLPPREITEKVTEQTGLKEGLDKGDTVALTYLAHFGYGTAAGLIYGVVAPVLPGPAWAKGMTFGVAVWAASYLGLLPSLDILRPATEHPAERNELMIASHLIWGATLGAITTQLLATPHASGR
jgi:uncharacterized membrane protein YagU involved in acid resistance